MPPCPSCGAAPDASWKFCIYCGTVLTEDAAGAAASATIPAAVPGAIRPEQAEAARSKLDVPLLIGIALGAAGAALIVYVAIALFAPR